MVLLWKQRCPIRVREHCNATYVNLLTLFFPESLRSLSGRTDALVAVDDIKVPVISRDSDAGDENADGQRKTLGDVKPWPEIGFR